MCKVTFEILFVVNNKNFWSSKKHRLDHYRALSLYTKELKAGEEMPVRIGTALAVLAQVDLCIAVEITRIAIAIDARHIRSGNFLSIEPAPIDFRKVHMSKDVPRAFGQITETLAQVRCQKISEEVLGFFREI